MKSIIALATLSALSATPAMAGPYVNTEINSGWTGSDYGGSVTDPVSYTPRTLPTTPYV